MAKQMKPSDLVYRLWDESEHGYTQTYVRVWASRAHDMHTIAERIAGCVGNADGYGTTEAADRMMERYKTLRERGVTHVFSPYSGAPGITIRWQKYKPREANPDDPQQYCEPEVQLDHYARQIDGAIALYQRLRKVMHKNFPKVWDTLDKPDTLVSTLELAGASRVYLHSLPDEGWGAYEYCLGSDDTDGSRLAESKRAAAE